MSLSGSLSKGKDLFDGGDTSLLPQQSQRAEPEISYDLVDQDKSVIIRPSTAAFIRQKSSNLRQNRTPSKKN